MPNTPGFRTGTGDHTHGDGAVVLLQTKTGFEAETIAAALNARGILARSADTAGSAVMSGVLISPKVLVPAHMEGLANQVLAEIKAEMTDVDWDELDLGPEEHSPQMRAARRGRRMLATLCVVLVPVGLMVLAAGMARNDATVQAIGGVTTLSALVIAMAMLFAPGRGGDTPD